jgi:hypothetical protein
MLCASGVGSQKLVTACGLKIPAFQAFCTYLLLAVTFTTQFACKTEATKIMKERWWKYIIIAAIDTYANFLVYTAYQYTSLTSVQVELLFRYGKITIYSLRKRHWLKLTSKYTSFSF